MYFRKWQSIEIWECKTNLSGFLFTRVIIASEADLMIFFPQFLMSRGRGEVKATTTTQKGQSLEV